MSDQQSSSLQCQLCGKQFHSKEVFLDHLNRHLDYRKYPCNSCNKRFYTKTEREEHCEKDGHDHVFNTDSKPYCEMMLAMLQKDNELLKLYDVDVVIAERRKSNAEFEKKVQTRPVKQPATPISTESPNQEGKKPLSCRTRKRMLSHSIANNETPPPAVNGQGKRSRVKNLSTSSVISETTNLTAIEPQQQPLPLSPTKRAAIVSCGICEKDIEMNYVVRKEHVAKAHLGSNHSEEDYVNLLETAMKKAFANLSYSDVQCQECLKIVRASRRNHVYDTHILKRIECPNERCGFSAVTSRKITKHMRTEHNLVKGHLSIENHQLRSDFEQKYKKHNAYVESLVDKCFPCAIPAVYQNQEIRKTAGLQSPPQLLNGFRQRFFQDTPKTKPLRRLSESTDSNEECSTRSNTGIIRESIPASESPEKEKEAETCSNDDRDTPLEFAAEETKDVPMEPTNSIIISKPCAGNDEFSQVETDVLKEINKAQNEKGEQVGNSLQNGNGTTIKIEDFIEFDDESDYTLHQNSYSHQSSLSNYNRPIEPSDPTHKLNEYIYPGRNRDTGPDDRSNYANTSRIEREDHRYPPRRYDSHHSTPHRYSSGRHGSSSYHERSTPRYNSSLSSERSSSYRRYDSHQRSYDRDREKTESQFGRRRDGESRSGGHRPLYTMRPNDR